MYINIKFSHIISLLNKADDKGMNLQSFMKGISGIIKRNLMKHK